jgi:hypothetical protein
LFAVVSRAFRAFDYAITCQQTHDSYRFVERRRTAITAARLQAGCRSRNPDAAGALANVIVGSARTNLLVPVGRLCFIRESVGGEDFFATATFQSFCQITLFWSETVEGETRAPYNLGNTFNAPIAMHLGVLYNAERLQD